MEKVNSFLALASLQRKDPDTDMSKKERRAKVPEQSRSPSQQRAFLTSISSKEFSTPKNNSSFVDQGAFSNRQYLLD